MSKLLLVDGDIVLFQIGRVTEDVTTFGEETMESFDHESAVRMIGYELDTIAKKTGYKREDILFTISDSANFRKRHHPTYKANRKNVRKPLGLKAMRQHMLDNADKYSTIMYEELEADDVMGMYGTLPEGFDENEYAIYSQDKDLFTIPVKQWDFKKNKFILPTALESVHFLYTQVLIGDPVDGYKGCPRIGKVKAAKALLGCENELQMLEACHKLYYKVYKEEAKRKLLDQIQQARILHHVDSILLMQHDMLYDPYTLLNVVEADTIEWEKPNDT